MHFLSSSFHFSFSSPLPIACCFLHLFPRFSRHIKSSTIEKNGGKLGRATYPSSCWTIRVRRNPVICCLLSRESYEKKSECYPHWPSCRALSLLGWIVTSFDLRISYEWFQTRRNLSHLLTDVGSRRENDQWVLRVLEHNAGRFGLHWSHYISAWTQRERIEGTSKQRHLQSVITTYLICVRRQLHAINLGRKLTLKRTPQHCGSLIKFGDGLRRRSA